VVDDFLPLEEDVSIISDTVGDADYLREVCSPGDLCTARSSYALTYAALRWWHVCGDDGSLLFWPVLLVKAMAKLTGSLIKVEDTWQLSGDRQQSIFFGPSFIDFDFEENRFDLSSKVAQKMATRFERGIPETVGTPSLPESTWNSSMHPSQNFNETGLIHNHAYSVVGAFTANELGVRNQSEWGNETFLLIQIPTDIRSTIGRGAGAFGLIL